MIVRSDPTSITEPMTDGEIGIVQSLAAVWNAFLKLPVEHGDDVTEFRQGIHALQDKVFARPARRALNSALTDRADSGARE